VSGTPPLPSRGARSRATDARRDCSSICRCATRHYWLAVLTKSCSSESGTHASTRHLYSLFGTGHGRPGAIRFFSRQRLHVQVGRQTKELLNAFLMAVMRSNAVIVSAILKAHCDRKLRPSVSVRLSTLNRYRAYARYAWILSTRSIAGF
jgi:hypothetical protein